MIEMDTTERRRRLARRHYLATPATDPVTVAQAMGGLHATDPASVYLSSWARISGFLRNDLDRELFERRTLLRVLGMRRTLFVVPVASEPILRQGCALRYLAAEERRLVTLLDEQHGHGAEWLMSVTDGTLRCLRELGEATATELKVCEPRLDTRLSFGEGKRWGGTIGMSTRILFLLAARGEIVRGRPRGSWLSGQYRWVPRQAWIDQIPPDPDPEAARIEIARRWLAGFGPGTLEDLKWWTGWGVAESRAAIRALGAVPVALDGGTGYVLATDVELEEPVDDWVALLPSLDPTPMGWRTRDWFLGDHGPALFDRTGNIGPTIWVNGRVVGGWGQNDDGAVVIKLLEPLPPDHQDLIEIQTHELESWLDGELVKPRFRTPLERQLGLD